MGCGSSTPHGAPAPSSKSSQQIAEALEKKLLQSIIDTKRRKSYKAKKSSVNGLMLQFPKLRAGFKIVREKFKELDKLGTGKVDFDTFKANCNSIGLDESTASIQEVFALADMEGTRQLNQTEFSLVFCIIYLLDTGPKKAIAFPEVKKVRAEHQSKRC